MWWRVVIGVIAGLALLWVVLVVLVWRAAPRDSSVQESLRLLPDLLRLLRRLAGDPSLPRGVRLRLSCLLVYVASPIDLIPDFIPVVGYADDAVIVALALRSVVRRAGPEALRRHWPGTPAGLATVIRLAGLPRS